MAINKILLRTKVKQAISQMPYNAIVKRESFNKRKEPIGLQELTNIVGTLYKQSTSKYLNINISNSGETVEKDDYRFIVDWNDNSIKIKTDDILEITVEGNIENYKVIDSGNINEVCFDIKLEKI